MGNPRSNLPGFFIGFAMGFGCALVTEALMMAVSNARQQSKTDAPTMLAICGLGAVALVVHLFVRGRPAMASGVITGIVLPVLGFGACIAALSGQ